MTDKLMYTDKDDKQNYKNSVDYKQWLKRLGTQLNKPTNQSSIRVPKVVKPTNKIT